MERKGEGKEKEDVYYKKNMSELEVQFAHWGFEQHQAKLFDH